jgi:hypothetical protein
VAAVALALTALLPSGDAMAGVLAFGLAGLGCSALLPLTISFGQRDLTAIGASVAGLLIACYQAGYGIAAFGAGPLQELFGIGLTTLFGATSLVAVAMGVIAVMVVRGHSRSGLAERGAVVHG